MNRKLLDLNNGYNNEKIIKPILEKTFKINLKKLDNYHIFDFIDENGCYYEVKSRNCNSYTYNTTMIGYNKIEEIKRLNCECYFIFMFQDGNYYYKYNSDNDFIICDGGRCDRGKKEIKKYCYIPVYDLNEI